MTIEKPVRARDRIFRAVRYRLITGAHRPGEKIKIRPLAEVLGTSTTPVREALLQLVAAGALHDDPQLSIRVPVLTAAEYAELLYLRTILECDVAAVAATRVTSAELEALEALALDLMDSTRNVGLIADFHFTLYRAAKMPFALPLIESLWLQTGPYLHLFEGSDALSWSRNLRGEILRGLRSRNEMMVREALKRDLDLTRDFISQAIDNMGDAGGPELYNGSKMPVRKKKETYIKL